VHVRIINYAFMRMSCATLAHPHISGAAMKRLAQKHFGRIVHWCARCLDDGIIEAWFWLMAVFIGTLNEDIYAAL
jgi:hypothetical protein